MQPAVWRQLTASSNGMGARRERLQVEDFLEYEFDLPDRTTQEIVIAIDALFRDYLIALDSEIATVEHIRARLREDLTQDLPMIPLSDVLQHISGGRSPKCLDRPPEPGEWGVLKTSSVRASRFDPREAKALPPDVEAFDAAAPLTPRITRPDSRPSPVRSTTGRRWRLSESNVSARPST